MNRVHSSVLLSLTLAAFGAHGNGPESLATADPHAAPRASATFDARPSSTHALSDQAIDDALDELDLLDPALDSDSVLDLLAELLPGANAAATSKGGPAAVGYVAHRKWGGVDGYRPDQFSGNSNGIYRGRAAARLENGDVVVVGDIQGGGVSTARNLGIVKYNSRGQRVAWSNVPSQFSLFNNQYIRFPNTDPWGNTRTVVAVHDVHVRGDDIYVLMTFSESGLRRPGITRWGSDGSSRGWWFAAPDSGAVRDAVAMDILGSHMIVLGRRSLDIEDADGGFWTARATINGDGGLSFGAITTIRSGVRMIPADIAFARSSLVVPVATPAYYVVDTVRSATTGSTATWPCIHRVTSDNVLDGGFGTGGFRCNPFNAPGASDLRDWAVAVHTRTETLFNAGNPITREVLFMSTVYDKNPADGIGLVKLVSGAPDTAFGGAQGQREYGGCNGTIGAGCSSIPIFNDTAHVPLRGALFADGNGVHVAGRTFRQSSVIGNPPIRRPILMHVNPGNGNLTSLQSFASTYPNSRFAALVPGESSAGMREFTVAGYAHHVDTTAVDDGPTRFLTAHLVRDSDLIFYDGLQP